MTPASPAMRRVRRLSSQRLIATAEVNSDSDSRVITLRPPMGEAQFAGLGVEHLHLDPASQRLVGNDPGVRVQVVDGLRR